MEMWNTIVIIVHVLIAVAIIGLVLLQHGKGADMGSGFGGGSSSSLFGATGSANFLSRTTAVLAALFFASSLGLSYFATHRGESGGGGIMDSVKEPPAAAQPAAPKPAAELPKPAAPAEKDGSKSKEVPN
jgi:preprotein translocase subunit SecG